MFIGKKWGKEREVYQKIVCSSLFSQTIFQMLVNVGAPCKGGSHPKEGTAWSLSPTGKAKLTLYCYKGRL